MPEKAPVTRAPRNIRRRYPALALGYLPLSKRSFAPALLSGLRTLFLNLTTPAVCFKKTDFSFFDFISSFRGEFR
jgi:hypothetical protein